MNFDLRIYIYICVYTHTHTQYICIYMNDVFNSITLVILKHIYSLTGKAPFTKRIYDLYFCIALVFSLFTLDYIYSLPHCNALDTHVRILFPMAIYIYSNNILVPSLAHRSSTAYYPTPNFNSGNRAEFSGRFSNKYFRIHYIHVLQLIIC